jgi:hypothetical protein
MLESAEAAAKKLFLRITVNQDLRESFAGIGPAQDPSVRVFFESIAANSCHYLERSTNMGSMRHALVNLSACSRQQGIELALKAACVFYLIELLKRKLTSPGQRPELWCCNVFLLSSKCEQPEKVLSVVHAFLKQNLTETGFVFGKFWAGENVPGGGLCPANFISIRSRVESLDRRFFTRAPELSIVLS